MDEQGPSRIDVNVFRSRRNSPEHVFFATSGKKLSVAALPFKDENPAHVLEKHRFKVLQATRSLPTAGFRPEWRSHSTTREPIAPELLSHGTTIYNERLEQSHLKSLLSAFVRKRRRT